MSKLLCCEGETTNIGDFPVMITDDNEIQVKLPQKEAIKFRNS